MTVRWRQHEKILAGVTAAILLAAYCWAIYNGYKMFYPDLGVGIVIYVAYLFANYRIDTIRTTPSYKVYWLGLESVLVIALLGGVLELNAYYRYQWGFGYPGHSHKLGGGPLAALLVVALFALYAGIREAVIAKIERSPRRAYLALICNQLTGFLVVFLSLPLFAAAFRLIHEGQLIAVYFSIVTPVYLMYMATTYWVFPLAEQSTSFSGQVLRRLLLAALLCGIPFFLFPVHEGLGFGYLGGCCILIFVTTPISRLFFQAKKDKIIQLRGMEKALSRTSTDLQFLRSQINPHFLFNVLNTVYSSALQENAERTAAAIQQLGDMMRFMLEENNQDFIPLKQEIEYLRNYVALQKMRTEISPEITVECLIDDEHCDKVIAPMLFIPFVENAFKHGIRLERPSWIKISLECSERSIRFQVRNSKHPPRSDDPEKTRWGIGNDNVIQRLNLVYPGRHELKVSSEGKEYKVILIIHV